MSLSVNVRAAMPPVRATKLAEWVPMPMPELYVNNDSYGYLLAKSAATNNIVRSCLHAICVEYTHASMACSKMTCCRDAACTIQFLGPQMADVVAGHRALDRW